MIDFWGRLYNMINDFDKILDECLDRIAKAGFAENIRRKEWGKPDFCQTLILNLSEGEAIYKSNLFEDPLD